MAAAPKNGRRHLNAPGLDGLALHCCVLMSNAMQEELHRLPFSNLHMFILTKKLEIY